MLKDAYEFYYQSNLFLIIKEGVRYAGCRDIQAWSIYGKRTVDHWLFLCQVMDYSVDNPEDFAKKIPEEDLRNLCCSVGSEEEKLW